MMLALLVQNEYVDKLFGYVKGPLFWIMCGLCVVGIIWSVVVRDDDDDHFSR